MKKPLSFPRTLKLTEAEEYKSLFDKSKKLIQKHFVVLYKANEKNHPRLGLVVSKRNANKANARNRIKRIIRESFRLNQTEIEQIDIIVIARRQCDKLSKQKLREDIDQIWEKLPS